MIDSTRTRAALLGLAGAALLASCSSSDEELPTVNTVALFSPDTGNIPLPNDLLFADSTDGTLNLPDDGTDTVAALNALDGWSTVAPITIPFSGPLDPTTIGGNPALPGQPDTTPVRVFEVTTTGIGGAVTGLVQDGELVQGVDHLVAPSPDGQGVVVLPLRPLAPDTSYLVTVTNGIRDADGVAVAAPLAYDLASSDFELDDPTLEGLRVLIQAQQAAAASAGVDAASIVMSFSFETQSIGGPLQVLAGFAAGGPTGDAAEQAAIESALAANPALTFTPDDPTGDQDPNALADPANTVSIGNFAPVAGLVDNDATIEIYQGELTIPSYLEPGQSVESVPFSQDTTPLTTRFRSRFGFGSPDDPGRHVTGLNPIPAVRGTVTIPVLVTVPAAAAAGETLQVALFVHGVTRQRGDLLGLQPAAGQVDSLSSVAGRMAQSNIACVAIDLPLHGLADDPDDADGVFVFEELFVGYATDDGNGPLRERTYGLNLVDNDLGVGPPTVPVDSLPDPSGFHVLGNLANLRTLRDDLRQGVADLLWLRSVIGDIDLGAGEPDLDGDDVSFVGQSLGAMVGVPYVLGSGAATLVSQALEDAPIDFRHSASVLSVPGGGIAELLLNSEQFGEQVATGIASQAGFDVTDPGFDLDAPDVQAVLAQFAFAAQSVLDDADPINFAASYAGISPPPTLLFEVVGNDGPTPNDPDNTIPNDVPIPGTPFFRVAGTDPLITALGLDPLTADAVNASGAIRFEFGVHGSLITPTPDTTGVTAANLQIAFDDQTDLATEYVSTAGTAVTLSDNTTVDTDG